MKKETSILQLPDEHIGKAFRALFAVHEDFVMATFGQSMQSPLTPKRVVAILREMGMDQYASQLYIFANGMMVSAINGGPNVFRSIKEWRAAFELAEQLEVPVDTISPPAALKYISNKQQ